jgi:hypothetical protein
MAAAQKLLPPEATDQEEDRHKTGSFGARNRRQLAEAARIGSAAPDPRQVE